MLITVDLDRRNKNTIIYYRQNELIKWMVFQRIILNIG